MAPYQKPIWERLFDRIEPQLNGCWYWKGALDRGGYGSFYANKESWSAHRFVYFFCNGTTESVLCVCHKCDVPFCVNPEHLFLGSNLDNINDRQIKGRTSQHERHAKAKLSKAAVTFIRSNPSVSGRKAARLFGVNKKTIYNVRHRRTWK